MWKVIHALRTISKSVSRLFLKRRHFQVTRDYEPRETVHPRPSRRPLPIAVCLALLIRATDERMPVMSRLGRAPSAASAHAVFLALLVSKLARPRRMPSFILGAP